MNATTSDGDNGVTIPSQRLDRLADGVAARAGWGGIRARYAIKKAILGDDFALRLVPGGDHLAEGYIMAIARLSYAAGNLGEAIMDALYGLPRRSRKED